MRNLLIISAVAILLYLLVGWFRRTPSLQIITSIRKNILWGVGAVLIVLVVTGRMHWLYGVIAGLIPVAQRLFTAWRTISYFQRFSRGGQNKNTASPGQTSSIQTPYLNMSLDHDNGEMSGIVLQGKYKDTKLTELSLNQLIELISECQTSNDTDSVAVLETYLDRYHNNEDTGDWRDQYQHTSNNTQSHNNSTMTTKEAYQILGIQQSADKKEIKEAHRRLMQKFHPDRGGSTYLSAKINQAKDLLSK